ncbi:Mob1/phocein [Cylindrobasidium torrendii FP15055 ss-10]|uniref:Mob1/phocein n=1 Tax=Cylindrobasidium torrendii FP15055 ss-10 TaxID=1314674 RepID=A0A0D7BAF9_9AGAR|nr:Mob1/phocein [Cylindrobasidium torrendii FP15055 ss-10]
MAVIIQRPLRGSRISSFYPVKTLPPLASLDSAFQLQEFISLLIRSDVHDVERIVSVPGKASEDKETAEKEKSPEKEVVVDEACWIYEQLRRLAQDLSHPLITTLQQECNRSTCPEMKAGEWLYLCVAHGSEGAMEQCCAIDYILHTLDSATALLNSPRIFPSRLHIDKMSHRHFSSLARRLGRIFAHAYFHHREAFEQAEAESSLYARFLALTTKFELVPAEFQVIPSRHDDSDVQPPRLMAAGVDPHDMPTEERVEDWQQQHENNRNPPGLRSDPPRKIGRNRTDTMVYSEAQSVVEELAKAERSPPQVEQPGAEDSPIEKPLADTQPEESEVAAAATDAPVVPTHDLDVTASSSTAAQPDVEHFEVFEAEPTTLEVPESAIVDEETEPESEQAELAEAVEDLAGPPQEVEDTSAVEVVPIEPSESKETLSGAAPDIDAVDVGSPLAAEVPKEDEGSEPHEKVFETENVVSPILQPSGDKQDVETKNVEDGPAVAQEKPKEEEGADKKDDEGPSPEPVA